MFYVNLTGAIDFVGADAPEGLNNVDALIAHAANLYNDDEVERMKYIAENLGMYAPLNLPAGVYKVTGIEGKFYDGYVPGKNLIDGVWVDAPGNDTPWPLEVSSNMAAIDLMQAVAKSEANGYPDVNHIYFEGVTIDPVARTIRFSMGS